METQKIEAWRLIQNNAIETRNADVAAMVATLEVIAGRYGMPWQHLTGYGWNRMTGMEQKIVSILVGRIEASA